MSTLMPDSLLEEESPEHPAKLVQSSAAAAAQVRIRRRYGFYMS
ncbi:MAG: hypothetical protein ACLR5S_01070 [Ruminococcus sp.]